MNIELVKNISVEREFSPCDADLRIEKILKYLSLSYKIKYQSDIVQHLYLQDKDLSPVSEACGKGKFCYIGAKAEALEHFALDAQSIGDDTYLTTEKISTQTSAADDGILRNLLNFKDIALACKKMSDFDNNTIYVPSQLLLPEIIGLPNDADEFLNRYSSNSGTAFGCTENEAILHALNEVIERYYLSKLYLGLIGKGEPLELFKIELSDNLIKDYQLFVTKTIFDNYFAIAISTISTPLRLIGSGASLVIDEAISRALTELQQIREVQNAVTISEDEHIKKILEKLNCHQLINLEINAPKLEIEAFEMKDQFSLTVSEQVIKLINNMKTKHYHVFKRQLVNFCNLGYVVQLYVPGLDRFHLLRTGNLVTPNEILLKELK